MRVRDHIIYSSLVTLVLFIFFRWPALLFLVFGILIDADHYVYYVFTFKDVSFLNAVKYFNRLEKENRLKEVKGKYFVFHSIEFLVFMALLSVVYRPMLFGLAGVFFHYVLDWSLEIYVLGSPLKATSLLEGFLKKK